MQSTNYELDSINFGTNFTLTTGQASVPPVISSEGPIVQELTPITAKIFWKTDKKSSSSVQYGTSSSYGLEIGSTDLVLEHTVTLLALTPETLYHYRVKSVDTFGGTTISDDKTFTTPAEAGISSIKISDVTYDKALISWRTGLFTLTRLEYGTTLSYGLVKETASRSFLTDHTVQLSDLKPGTDYHFRIVAEDEKGVLTRSPDLIFTTIANPKFESITAIPSPETGGMIIKWKTNVFTSGIVTYKSQFDQKELSAGDTTLQREHNQNLINLLGLTEYTYRVTATDSQGKQITSEQRTFTTPKDSSPPKITDLKVNVTRSGESLVLTATWKTNKPTKSKVSYNPKTNAEAITELPPETVFTNEHVAVTSGLSPSTPYTLRVVASDPYNNEAEQTINFVSPSLRKSILQLILDSILKPFGWLLRAFGG